MVSMGKFLFFFAMLLLGNFAWAQNNDSAYVEEETVESIIEDTNPFDGMVASDSLLKTKPQTENKVYPKKFKEDLRAKYQDDEFNYDVVKPQESFLERLMKKINRFIDSLFGNNLDASFSFGKVLLKIFAILLVGFVIYFLIKYLIGSNIGFFGKKNTKTEINEEDLHENIHEINFVDTISKFENSAEYRLAVRYQFLLILKKLSDKKLISWNPEKTNRDYSNEIKDGNLKNKFIDLALIFDYIWYGEFSIDHHAYTKFKEQFQEFKP